MPDPTPDPIRAACEAAARELEETGRIDFDVTHGYPPFKIAPIIARHLRGPLTERERAAVEALRFYASEPNHRDARGTGGESDVFQDGGARARAALSHYYPGQILR